MSTRTHSALIFGSLFAVGAIAWTSASPASLRHQLTLHAASGCDGLTALTIPQVRIVSATDVAAGSFSPVEGGTALTVPAFCRVVAVATPTSDSTINFEVWLPVVDAWNRKFQGVGNTGWAGVIPYAGMADALRRGYAAAGTDTGHVGDNVTFAAGHPEKVVDWAYRAVRVMTTAGKLIVRARQGALPRHSYFVGCGTGGGQALMAAQRFPEDYNGIIACNPGHDRVDRFASYLWGWNAAHQTPESPISQEKLLMVNEAVVATCDNLDGVKDGVIDDPRRCNFDPGALLCRGEDNGKCLSSRQLETLRKVYNGPHNARLVQQIFPGVPVGSEGSGWQRLMEGTEPPDVGFWRHIVFSDPAWDFRTFDWDSDLQYAHARVGGAIDADNPDLGPFKARGGKIIMTAGWNDAVHVPEQTIRYYDAVEREMGKDEKTRDFFRLFMAPGMPGSGPGTFDALGALEMWVEHQVPPERLVASRPAVGTTPLRTRPLCPYPQVARWKGNGSTDEAANFNCTSPPKK